MNQRSLKIMGMLNEQGNIDVNELAKELGVSSVTIRKDLAFLEEKGLLYRKHGYAMPISPNDIAYRMTFDYEIKKGIAKRAAEMVKSGETVMIESGSTCAMLAAELTASKRDVCIVTYSAFIAEHIRNIPGAKITLLGGSYDPDAQVMLGPLIRKYAKEFYVDKFFVGTDAYDTRYGFFNVDMQRAEAVQAMAESAENCIILTDSSKFNRRSVVVLMPADQVSMVVTNAIPDNCRESLEQNGVKIILA